MTTHKRPLLLAFAGVALFLLGQLPSALGAGSVWLALPFLMGLVAGSLWVIAFIEWRWSR
jgi:hypothetical protein